MKRAQIQVLIEGQKIESLQNKNVDGLHIAQVASSFRSLHYGRYIPHSLKAKATTD